MRSRSVLLLTLLLSSISYGQYTDLGNAAEKRWHIKEVLADKNTMQLAKDIYQGKWQLSNENVESLLHMLDSFPKMDPAVKGFYFVVIAKSFDKSDGAYSEGLGASGKDYVDHNITEFLNYFCGEGKLPDIYLHKWAAIVANEMEKVKVDQDHKIQSKISKIYDAKCKDCRSEQKAVLKKFEELLKMYIK
jgi:hypothetical protein